MKENLRKTWHSFRRTIPIMIGVLLLINLISPVLRDYYPKIFTGNFLFDPFIGAIAGSISFGMPILSYIIAGELLGEGISILAVTAFILTWSTVGVAMLPLEISYLGRRFAVTRNIINFIFALVIAVLTVITLDLII